MAEELEELIGHGLGPEELDGLTFSWFRGFKKSRGGPRIRQAILMDHPEFHRILRSFIELVHDGVLPRIMVGTDTIKLVFSQDFDSPEHLKREVSFYDLDPSRLSLIVDLDAIPADIVSRFLGALDRVHRAWGGGGLELESVELGKVADAVVAV